MIDLSIDALGANGRRPWRWLAIVLLIVAAIVPFAPGASAQSSYDVYWENYDVTIDVRDNGILHITERQVIDFDSAGYQSAYADIPLKNTDGITNVTVSEVDDSGKVTPYRLVNSSALTQPGTYRVSSNESTLSIDYRFKPVNYDTRTFVLEYDVVNGVRAYPELDPPNQQVWWNAITSDTTEVAPVMNATVTLNLPEAVPLDQTQIIDSNGDLGSAAEHSSDGKTFTWTASNLRDGDDLEVRVQFPPILDIQPPDWQLSDDEEREAAQRQEDRQNLFNVIFAGIAAFGLMAGGVALFGYWYTQGRDPQTGLVADFLPEPPDDLPPGLAGVLLDERADKRDVVATIVDLSRRGLFQIQEGQSKSGPTMEIVAKSSELPTGEFEKALVSDLFNGKFEPGRTVPIVAGSLTDPMNLRNRLYDDAVARGLFEQSPEKTRVGTRNFGFALMVIGVALGFILPGAVDSFWVLLPCAVLVLLGFGVRRLAAYAPRKTLKGAEAAAKWRAFYRYLDDIEKYDKIEESTDIFEKYLAYATAFGLDSSWVNKFARFNAPVPSWYGGPVIIGDLSGSPSRPRRYDGGSSSGGGMFNIPSGSGDLFGGDDDRDGGGSGGLQDWSDSAARGLQGASNSLVDILNSAGRALGSFSSSGGGGGGSSSRSRGSFGSRGGGSRGFSGGGSRGGGGGGGKRGFSR